MSYNYSVNSDFLKSRGGTQRRDGSGGYEKPGWSFARFAVSKILLMLLLMGVSGAYAQTTLISPSKEGSFENGATFQSNGWTVVNGNTNQWFVGGASGPNYGVNAAYISNDGGVTNAYSTEVTANKFSYFYRDITVPAGETVMSLSFNWKGVGDATDGIGVFATPTTYTPVGDSQTFSSPSGQIYDLTNSVVLKGQTDYTKASYYVPAVFAGTTFRLIFMWKNNTTGGVQPPSSIDDISLVSSAPRTFQTATSGDILNPAVWVGSELPSAADNIVINAGHAITIGTTTTSFAYNDVTVNGTVSFVPWTSTRTLTATGNFTVNTGGVFNIHDGTKGQGLTVYGDIVNNGLIKSDVNSFGGLTLFGNQLQTVSGTGSWGNYLLGLTVNNTSTSVPAVQWNMDVSIGYSLTFTHGTMSIGTGHKMIFGTSLMTYSKPSVSNNNSGILAGSKFSHYFKATDAGSIWTAGADPSSTQNAGLYPFVTASGDRRWIYVNRTTTGTLQEGELSMVYNDNGTVTQGLNIADGTATINYRYNSNWQFAAETAATTNNYNVCVVADNSISPLNGNSRIMYQNSSIAAPSVHENGTLTPSIHRLSLTEAQLTSAPLYIGLASTDSSVFNIKSGDWEDDTIWNTGTAPTSTQAVTISKGTAVALNSPLASDNIVVTPNASLTFNDGSLLVVGATNNNHSFINNGTVTIQPGSNLTINGYLTSTNSATFIQNGGDVIIDGNDNGNTATSVATGTKLCFFNPLTPDNLQLNGGNLTIVDPHVGSAIGSDYAVMIQLSGSVAGYANKNHNLIFGDGQSTTPGSVNGFWLTNQQGKVYSLGTVKVNSTNAGNRFVFVNNNNSYYSMVGDLNIIAGGEFKMVKSLYVGGNVVNNGTLTFGSTSSATFGQLAMSLWDGVALQPSTNPQMILGTGVFQNLTLAGLNNQIGDLIINNTSDAGVTMNIPLSMAGTLKLNNGILNTTSTNILTIGSDLAAGGVAQTVETSYINGPLNRYIGIGNTNAAYLHFPVGTSTAYAPIWMAPTTQVAATVHAQAFDTNAGTADPSINGLAANRRWELPVIAGSIVDANIKFGDSNLVAGNIPVMASSAAGVYNKAAGDLSVFTASTGALPNVISTTMPITSANYQGFISYANASTCLGTPNPGNTIASSTTLCLGQSVALSLQNLTSGGGISYAWQSSTDGVNYTSITDATLMAYTAIPQVATYYRCVVTCAAGNVSKNSTPVFVNFPNMVGATGSAFRCGYGNVALTASSPAGTINWYDAPIGGNLLGTGSPFTTPNISQTTTYYAAAETNVTGTTSILPTQVIGTHNSNAFVPMFFASTADAVIKSIDIYPAVAGDHVFTMNAQGKDKTSAGNTLQTYTYTVTPAQVASGLTTSITIPVNFSVPAGAVGYSINCNQSVNRSTTANAYSYPYVQGAFSVTGTGFAGDGVGLAQNAQSSKMYSYNWIISTQLSCSSARVPVTATVTPSPAITIDQTAPVTLCFATPSQLVKLTSPVANYDTYTWSPSTGVTGDAVNGWTFNSNATTTYTLVATKAGGCSAAVTLVVNSGPAGVVAAQTLPTGSTVASLTPAPCTFGCSTGVIKWYASNTATTALTTGTALTTATQYWVSITPTGLCESPRIPVTVTLGTVTPPNPPVAPTATAIQGFCNTGVLGDLVISGTTGAITWYDAATGGNAFTPLNTSTNTGIYKKALVSGTTYYVTQTVNYVESARTAVKAMNLSPTPTGNATQTVCVSGTVADLRVTALGGLDGVTPGTVKWYDAATGGNVLASTTPLVNNTHYFAAQVQPNGSGTCESTARFDVTAIVNANVLTPTFTQVAAVCQGATMTALPTVSNNGIVGAWAPALNNTATTQYTFTPASGSCNTATMSITVNVVSAPTAAAQTLCSGSTVANLTATGTAPKWYTAATGGTALATTTALTTATTYYASQTVSGCESVTRQSAVVTLNVTAKPTAAAQTVCGSAPTVAQLVATGVAGNTIKWYAALTGGTALATTAAIATGTYYVTQTDATTTCESTPRVSVAVTVPKTAAPTGTAAQNFCSAATVANLAATGTAIKWYADATTTTALNSTDALVSGNHYFATQTVSGCESVSRFDVTATINATLVPAFTQVSTICQGGTFTLPTVSNNGIVGTWAPAVNNQAPTLYTFTPAAGTCTATMTVGVNITAAPTATAAQSFCNSATVANLLPAAGLQYKWYAAATGGTSLSSSSPLTTATNYYVSQIDGTTTCESVARTAVAVTVNATVAPTVVNQGFCPGKHVSDLVATGVTGATIKWYADATTTTAYNSTDELQTGSYFYSQVYPNGCESLRTATTAITVSVFTVGAPIGNSVQSYCNADTVQGLAIMSSGTITWYNASTGGTVVAPTSPLVVGQNYYASQTINGCESVNRLMVVASNLAPTPTGAAAQTFCAGATVANLTATGTAVKWYDAATAGNLLAANAVLVDGTHYYATQTVSACESAGRLDVIATVNTTSAPTGASAQTFCNSATVANLTATGTGTITWYDAATAGNALATTAALVDGTHYYATQTVNGCESATRLDVTAQVTTVAAPVATSPQAFSSVSTISNLVVTVGTNVQWYASSNDALANTNELAVTTVLQDGVTYYAMQTVNGCRSVAPTAVLVQISLGVDQFEQSLLQYYPNPVVDVLNVTHSSVITSISMFNVLGQHVMTVRPEATSARVDMSTLPVGTYLLQIEVNGKTTMAKVVKNQ